MKNIGIISEINGKEAKIKVLRESACGGNCASCSSCELKNHFIDADIEREFDFSPKVGDKVQITMDDKLFYTYAILGYGIFVVFLIAGAVLGWNFYKNENSAIIGGALGIVAGFCAVKLIFKNKKTGLKVSKTEEKLC